MGSPPEPPEDGSPANDEAPGAVRPEIGATADPSRPIDETAVDEAPVAVGRRVAPVMEAEPSAAGPGPAVDETAPDPPPVADGARPTAEEAPRPAEEAPRPGRTWLRVTAAIVGVLLGAAVAVALILPGYLRGRVLEEARALGVVLQFKDVDVGFARLKLDGVTLSLVGVPDLEVAAEHIEVDLEDWQPRAVHARGLAMSLSGTRVLDQLSAWKARNPKALAAPFDAEGATVEWHPVKGAEKALSFGEARVTVDPRKGNIAAGQAVFIGRAAGPVNVGWAMEDGGFTVEIRPQAAPLSAIKIDIASAKDASPRERPQVKMTLARTKLAELQTALGIPKGSEGLEAEGELTMPLPSLEQPAPIEGSVRLSVKGYVPPHPKELQGILFGDVTKVRADFTIQPDFAKAKLAQVQVEAGALVLRGLGDVDRDGFDAMIALTLKGTIPCAALATSAAAAHFGQQLGKIAGGIAAGTVRGNVSVVLSIEAKASDIQGAKIDKHARLNCKVGLPGLPKIILN
jgi:ADP-dependent NAD(P)H-hydrate dehydratase / NAD(P)H-hydrate epimerase